MPAAGYYRDAIWKGRALRWHSGGWSRNLIVASTWPLVAALLRNEPGIRGILFCAFGEGDAAWDGAPATPSPEQDRLRREVVRVAIEPQHITYVDAAGQKSASPTHRLALSVTVPKAGAVRQFREFGLVGGDAAAAPNSGRLINYAIHPVIAVGAGATFTREIRLSFRPGGTTALPDTIELPKHWLADEPVTTIDGVGAVVAKALADAGVTTVAQLAELKPASPVAGLSVSRAVELRAKARLAVETAAQLARVPDFDQKTVDDVLSATGAGASPATLFRLQTQLGLLQVALDARRLRKLTIAELTHA